MEVSTRQLSLAPRPFSTKPRYSRPENRLRETQDTEGKLRSVQVLRRFLLSKTPSRAEAAAGLRFAYVVAFLGQCLFVGVIGLAMWLVLGRQEDSSPLVAQALLYLSLLELPVALLVAHFVARPGGKGGALTGVIALAVILSTPAWLALFAWMIGSASSYVLLLLLVLFLSYGVGFLRVNSYVAMAVTEPKKRDGGES